ncbi:GAP family protein [Microbacterium sp. A588]
MLSLLGDILTLGIGVAISPLAIVAVILMATSGKGRTNGTAFVLGCYTLAVLLVGALVLIGRASGSDEADSGANITVDVLEILLGVGLLALAVHQWSKRSEVEPPKWLMGLDQLTIGKAFLLGVLLSGPLSPKDVPLLIAASGRISQAHLPAQEVIPVILLFGLIGISAVAVPWLISVVAPGSVERRLTGARSWLLANHSVVMTVLFVILGFKLIGSGIADLAG